MKKILGYIAAAACVGMLSIPSALAKPAKRTQYTVSNPDGTTVVLTKVGDEFFHCYLTEDGYPVQQDADGWYRVVGNNGELTDIVAANPTERNAKASAAISAINPQIAYTANQHEVLTNSKMYQTQRVTAPMMRMGAARANSAIGNDGHNTAAFPCQGEQKVLAIMVNFTDMKFSFCENPGDEMRAMLHEPGYSNYGATGSAYDFYVASSNGIFQPSFDVYGPVELDNPYRYYGQNDSQGNDMRPGQMVREACQKLDDTVDFSQYDRDGDGFVDNIYIFYAGHGEADYNDRNTIWPHSWDLSAALGTCPTLDGVKLDHYACSAELNGYDNDNFDGIGTFCHEFAHVLGLPDLYTTDYGSAYNLTPGAFSALDYGPYNNNGKTPPVFSSYERYALDWIEPILIEDNCEVVLPPLTSANQAYYVKSNSKDTEYFLFENRQQQSWDTYIPASGMLVWHIDYKKSAWDSNTVNNTAAHQCVDIVEADGKASADKGGDTFPGVSQAFDFDANTPAKFVNWSNRSTGFSLNTIEQNFDGSLSFNVVKDGSSNDALTHQTPQVRYDNLTGDGFTALWEPVEGATEYLVSVYPLEDGLLPAETVTETVQDYFMKSVGQDTSIELDGLEPETVYCVGVNALFEDGMSRPGTIYVQIPDYIITDSPAIFVNKIDGADVTLAWSSMEDADSYDLTVAKRTEATDVETETYGFDNNKVPAGWDYIGGISSTNGTYGQAAPSIKLNHQADFIESEEFDKDIAKLKFWAKAVADDPRARVEVYGKYTDGSMVLADKIIHTGVDAKTYEVEFPAGVRTFFIYYFYSRKNQNMYFDDLEVTLAGGYNDTPVAGYAAKNMTETEHKVLGLDEDTEYVAYVQAHKGGSVTDATKAVKFKTGTGSGVNTVTTKVGKFSVRGGIVIPASQIDAYDIYTVDGTLLARGIHGSYQLPAHGLYIVRTASTASKIAW